MRPFKFVDEIGELLELGGEIEGGHVGEISASGQRRSGLGDGREIEGHVELVNLADDVVAVLEGRVGAAGGIVTEGGGESPAHAVKAEEGGAGKDFVLKEQFRDARGRRAARGRGLR